METQRRGKESKLREGEKDRIRWVVTREKGDPGSLWEGKRVRTVLPHKEVGNETNRRGGLDKWLYE